MVKIEYPKWKYHPTKDALIVNDEAADVALGLEWADSPAGFSEVEPALVPQEKKRKSRA